MSKYVIELRPDCKVVQQICESDGQVSIGAKSIEYLEELNADYVNEHFGILQDDAYNAGFENGKKEAYQKGLEDGKKAFDLLGAERDSEYQRGLSEGNDIGYKDGVKDGQNEAWEVAKKLFSQMADSDMEKAFPIEWNNGGFKALMNLQPQEAIEKLKAYEDDKIKRGDIVNVKGSCNDDLLGVVTKVGEDNCYIVWGDGSGGAWSKDSVAKTGKHIDVDKFFGEIAT